MFGTVIVFRNAATASASRTFATDVGSVRTAPIRPASRATADSAAICGNRLAPLFADLFLTPRVRGGANPAHGAQSRRRHERHRAVAEMFGVLPLENPARLQRDT